MKGLTSLNFAGRYDYRLCRFRVFEKEEPKIAFVSKGGQGTAKLKGHKTDFANYY